MASLAVAAMVLIYLTMSPSPSEAQQSPTALSADHLFDTHQACIACHNGLVTSLGEDVSIGFAWRSSMMANSARDPYWHAAVRREVMDHPESQGAIEDECSKCHMPMARYSANVNGLPGSVFEHLPIGSGDDPQDLLAADGVSCTLCHQITEEGLWVPRKALSEVFVSKRCGPTANGRSTVHSSPTTAGST